jgi:hypothetical protein
LPVSQAGYFAVRAAARFFAALPVLFSPMLCSRRKLVDPDFVRVPATIAITSLGRT